MELNETESENWLADYTVHDENYNLFNFGFQPIDATDWNIQLDDDKYQTLPTVPLIDTAESINQFVVLENDKATKNNIAKLEPNREKKTENSSGDTDDDTVEKNDYCDYEELSTTIVKKSEQKDHSNFMWKDQRPTFECTECSYGTKKKYLIRRHLKTHKKNKIADTNGKNIRGSKDKKCVTTITMNREVGADNADRPRRNFACNECLYRTDRKYLLSRHIITHTGQRPHKCKICERGFTTKASMQSHVNMHYGIKNQICSYCEKSFTTSGELSRHVKYIHTQEKPHKCTECEYAAVELSKLKRHMRYHTGERPYQCQHCTYASHDNDKLKWHLRKHTGEKPYKCDICNGSYARASTLKSHQLVHDPTQQKKYSCDLCPTKMARKSQLRSHVQRMHYSNRLLKCKRCEEIFSDLYSYKLHNKTHQKKNCFKCQICSFITNSFSHFKSHVTVHTGKKRIVCNQCDQSFVANCYLRRHQYQCHNKTYVRKEKPHVCQKCNRAFAYKACLNRHEAAHGEELNNHSKHLV